MSTYDKRSARTHIVGAIALSALLVALSAAGAKAEQVTLTVALAANPQMETAAKLIENFYEKNPDIKVKFQILPENQLRPTVLKDVATNSGQFDVVMIGAYEVPLWAEKGWIVDLSKNYVAKDTDWKAGDLIPAIKDLVSDKGEMYATPFYGSSSFMFYRKDLFEKAGLTMPVTPTWDQIAEFAAKLDDKANGVAGICLRGIPGWGQSLAPLTTVINTYGGRWFDENWNVQLSSPKTKAAIDFYVNLIKSHGEPDAAKDGMPATVHARQGRNVVRRYGVRWPRARSGECPGQAECRLRYGADQGEGQLRLAVGVGPLDPQDEPSSGRGMEADRVAHQPGVHQAGG
jgi:sorbitol/mannitol transport system substrate-binding protein